MSKANLNKKYDSIFFSPHLDDAVLSVGGFIDNEVKKRKKILIVTFFTAGNDSLELQKDQIDFLQNSFSKKSEKLFVKRKKEDIKATQFLQCDFFHFKYCDAFFRVNKTQFLYPSYNDLFSGKIHTLESVEKNIQKDITTLLKQYSHEKTHLFAPLGVGAHVDHILISRIFQKRAQKQKNISFWQDVPYRNHISSSEKQISQIQEFPQISFYTCTAENQKRKKKACSFYKSQIHSLEKNGLGDIDYKKETFFKL